MGQLLMRLDMDHVANTIRFLDLVLRLIEKTILVIHVFLNLRWCT
jgi:hypothetical protein